MHDNIMMIQYEDFIRNFDRQLESIFLYLGVTPISKTDVVRCGSIPNLKGSKFDNNTVRNGLEPHEKLIDNWKNALTPEQILQIEIMCAKEMKAFGYKTISNTNCIEKKNLKECRAYFKDVLIIAEYLHKWPSYLFHTLVRKIVFYFFYLAYKTRGQE